MINIDYIPIFIAINKEYGTDELIKRIKNILNIDLSVLLYKEKKFNFNKNSITITDTKTGVSHTIEFEQEGYKYTKNFKTYYIVRYYDFSKTEVRRLAAFDTSDNELLVVDEIDEEEIVTRRITKTTKEDTDFINGSFEKEELSYHKHNAHERYRYTEDLCCNKKVSKQIEMPNNLYTYSYRTTINSVSSSYNYGYIESSSCIDIPKLKVAGRIRDKNELLISSVKTPLPNILIRGRNVTESDKKEIELYNISIYKINNTLHLVFTSYLLPFNIQNKEEYNIESQTSGKLTIEDIDKLLEYLSNNLDNNLYNEVKQELINIRCQILAHKNRNLQNFDFFDGRFIMFNQFEYLAFDIYENLPYYESMINKAIYPDKGENPPTLKKIWQQTKY